MHMSSEILSISKVAFKKGRKPLLFMYFLNKSIDATEHFLHTSNEMLRISKIAFQKSEKTIAFYILFE